MNTTIESLTSCDPAKLDPQEIFSHLPPTRVGEVDRRYVEEVLDAGFGNWESADMIERFESAFAEKFGVPYAITHNSGSGTMLSCLLAAGIGPGAEVIVPTFTMAATAFVVIQAGAVPVFADSDPRTFNIDPADVERKITPLTRAVIPVHLFGLPVEMDAIMALAKKHDLVVIEDSAQCFLATYRGKIAGTIGDAGSWSFQGSKHMTTASDGGIVTTANADLGRNIRKAAIQGYRTLDAAAGSSVIPRDERQDYSYKRHDRMGYNFRMSAIQAALGLSQLERLDLLVAARRYIFWRYDQVIAQSGCEWLVRPVTPDHMTHSCYVYPCLVDEEKLGEDWRTFRKVYIEKGGDGLYGASSPVHLEPTFQEMTFHDDPQRAPNFDPRYKGDMKDYKTVECPMVESFRKRLSQMRTGMQTLEKVEREMDALEATIRHFG